MIGDLMYIELKTGYSYDGPAWIGYVKTSKSKKRIFEWEEIEIQILLIYNDLEEEVWLLGNDYMNCEIKRIYLKKSLQRFWMSPDSRFPNGKMIKHAEDL